MFYTCVLMLFFIHTKYFHNDSVDKKKKQFDYLVLGLILTRDALCL